VELTGLGSLDLSKTVFLTNNQCPRFFVPPYTAQNSSDAYALKLIDGCLFEEHETSEISTRSFFTADDRLGLVTAVSSEWQL